MYNPLDVIAAVSKFANPTIFYLDGVEIEDINVLENLQMDQITELSILKGDTAKKQYGDKAEQGVVVIVTKEFAIKRYRKIFSNFSDEYSQFIEDMDPGEQAFYVVDTTILGNRADRRLYRIKPEEIDSINVIPPNEATDIYGEKGVKGAVIIYRKKE